jgi:hypothetical protein
METEADMESYLALNTLVQSSSFSASEIIQPAHKTMDNARRGVILQGNRASPTPD